MPRFVILTHNHPFLHWDLLLEQKNSLKTWRLLKEPEMGLEIEAEPLPDHRLVYLEYEGPVSKNRGAVKQWDKGEYQVISENQSVLVFDLQGNKIKGTAKIEQEDEKASFILE